MAKWLSERALDYRDKRCVCVCLYMSFLCLCYCLKYLFILMTNAEKV